MILASDGLYQFVAIDEFHYPYQDEENPSIAIIFEEPDNYIDTLVVFEPDGKLLSKEDLEKNTKKR